MPQSMKLTPIDDNSKLRNDGRCRSFIIAIVSVEISVGDSERMNES
jgi:hypothetical protein